VPTQHGAIGYGDVFAGGGPFTSIGIAPAFNGNAIIAHANVAIGNAHVAARLGLMPSVLGEFGLMTVNTIDGNVVAKLGVDGPKWRIYKISPH
jgi:hypothetical protein